MGDLQTTELAQIFQKLSLKVEADNEDTRVKEKQISNCNEASETKQDTSTTTSDEAEDQSEWRAMCHSRLPRAAPPCYFINKQAVIYSNIRGETKLMKQRSTRFVLYIGTKKGTSFKLAEIMAYTFWDQPFNPNVHWFFYKDGNRENCEWDNLVICDLFTLQQLEIARLEKSNPGTKYTVVRNVHDTKTFERYLVSDAGKVYSLVRRIHLQSIMHLSGYLVVSLYQDIDDVQTILGNDSFTSKVHSTVLQSFKGRRIKGLQIDHWNGNKQDNSLQNLEFVTASENRLRSFQSVQKDARDMRRKQGDIPKKYVVRPLPPITEETRWKIVGIVPWNGQSHNQYEVSDMGHLRKLNGKKLLKQSCTANGYIYVCIRCDDVKNDISTRTTRIRFNYASVSRLVANAFVDGYSETQSVVKHLNSDRQDNRAQNLKWVSRNCASLNGIARRVVATLADDPDAQNEFPTIRGAERELSISIKKIKHGETILRNVCWDGTKKLAYVQVF